jgi:deoxyribose-phosphate aldolase
MTLTREALAAMIDYTMLKPETTQVDAEVLARDGAELGVASICIPASLVAEVPRLVPISCVIGFPSGAHRADVKALEAELALADGADELDMVINLGAAHSGRFEIVADEIRMVRSACPGRILKVILESATLADEPLRELAVVARDAGADFLKTSTGFHPAGGATVEAVALLASVAVDSDRPVGVKASGGIRTFEAAFSMIHAGATRIGASAIRAILDGAPG